MRTLIILALGFWGGYVWAKKKFNAGERGLDVNAQRHSEKETAKARVMEMFSDASELTNNDVEKSLGISDKTAERYLQELVSEGKLTQIGSEGRFIKYRKS